MYESTGVRSSHDLYTLAGVTVHRCMPRVRSVDVWQLVLHVERKDDDTFADEDGNVPDTGPVNHFCKSWSRCFSHAP